MMFRLSSGFTSCTEYQRHVWAWLIGGLFAIVATIVSLWEMNNHRRFNDDPALRRCTLTILFMVPVYSTEAWLGLYQKTETEYWDLLRECYEALVIFAFFEYLMSYLQKNAPAVLSPKSQLRTPAEPHHHDVHAASSREPRDPEFHHDPEHLPPCCCLPKWDRVTGKFETRARIGVLQYIPVKIGCAVAIFICDYPPFGVNAYEDGKWEINNLYPYVTFLVNGSQIWAMYCLILFLHGNAVALKRIQPVRKVLCIKGVVFFTFWQSVGIAGLVQIHEIQATQTYTVGQVSAGLQDFLVCIEMFIAAIAHHYAFPPKEFNNDTLAQQSTRTFSARATPGNTRVAAAPTPQVELVKASAPSKTVTSKGHGQSPKRPLTLEVDSSETV